MFVVCAGFYLPVQELDRYTDSRSLIHSGTLARRSKSDMDWNPWYDLYIALLDNYCGSPSYSFYRC